MHKYLIVSALVYLMQEKQIVFLIICFACNALFNRPRGNNQTSPIYEIIEKRRDLKISKKLN